MEHDITNDLECFPQTSQDEYDVEHPFAAEANGDSGDVQLSGVIAHEPCKTNTEPKVRVVISTERYDEKQVTETRFKQPNNCENSKMQIVSFASGVIFGEEELQNVMGCKRPRIEGEELYVRLETANQCIAGMVSKMEGIKQRCSEIISDMEIKFKLVEKNMRASYLSQIQTLRQEALKKMASVKSKFAQDMGKQQEIAAHKHSKDIQAFLIQHGTEIETLNGLLRDTTGKAQTVERSFSSLLGAARIAVLALTGVVVFEGFQECLAPSLSLDDIAHSWDDTLGVSVVQEIVSRTNSNCKTFLRQLEEGLHAAVRKEVQHVVEALVAESVFRSTMNHLQKWLASQLGKRSLATANAIAPVESEKLTGIAEPSASIVDRILFEKSTSTDSLPWDVSDVSSAVLRDGNITPSIAETPYLQLQREHHPTVDVKSSTDGSEDLKNENQRLHAEVFQLRAELSKLRNASNDALPPVDNTLFDGVDGDVEATTVPTEFPTKVVAPILDEPKSKLNTVSELRNYSKQLEAKVKSLENKQRAQARQKLSPGPEAQETQLTKELELKCREMEISHKKQVKDLEQQIAKLTKSSTADLKKTESHLQKLQARTSIVEQELSLSQQSLKEAKANEDRLSKIVQELSGAQQSYDQAVAELSSSRVKVSNLQQLNCQLEESYKEEKLLRKRYYNEIEDMKGKIRVYCRVRPMAQYETAKGCGQAVILNDEFSITVRSTKTLKEFLFDRSFGETSTQTEVYNEASRLIQSAVDGYNVCIFAYGQTGSGKTFTIQGGENNPGIAPRAIDELFSLLDKLDSKQYSYSVECYMLELYNNQFVDLLLSKDQLSKTTGPLEVKKDANGMVRVSNITTRSCDNSDTLARLFAWGLDSRHTGSTQMNSESSRSHLVFSVIIKITDAISKKTSAGKLSLIDLAGSERVSKTGATKERLNEAREINKSLSALGDVISALSAGEAFIPYRNHKLTQLMSDSLGGNAKTLMFVNVSPADYNADETLTSLMYASRVKLITNESAKTVESQEVSKLKTELERMWGELTSLRQSQQLSMTDNSMYDGNAERTAEWDEPSECFEEGSFI